MYPYTVAKRDPGISCSMNNQYGIGQEFHSFFRHESSDVDAIQYSCHDLDTWHEDGRHPFGDICFKHYLLSDKIRNLGVRTIYN